MSRVEKTSSTVLSVNSDGFRLSWRSGVPRVVTTWGRDGFSGDVAVAELRDLAASLVEIADAIDKASAS